MSHKKILFLYTELAGYFIACLRELGKSGHQVTVLHWPVNPEAPFKIDGLANVQFVERSTPGSEEVVQLIKTTGPDLILCSGWIDKGYIRALAKTDRLIPRVLLMDTQWNGGLKQKIMASVGSVLIRRLFTHAWVAGESQKKYALKMGFPEEKVNTGFYTADTLKFEALFQSRRAAWDATFPKKFLYVGRYVAHKGISDLCQAFIDAKRDHPSDWELICIGTGEDFPERIIHEDIQHLGFLQPHELVEAIRDAGVFVLPSYEEPWGVVVHEMAQAGFPLLLSEKVGAAEVFLSVGVNGFDFAPGEVSEIKEKIIEFMAMSDSQLRAMAMKSHEKAQVHSLAHWKDTLLLFIVDLPN